MPAALALAPLTVALVLLVSGVAKLGDRAATGTALHELRLPTPLRAGWVTWALPVAELVVAGALLSPWRGSYAAGAGAATVLMLAFLVVVARAMTFHPRPACPCFGRMGDHRIGARTLARNVALVVLATIGAWLAGQGSTAVAALADLGGPDLATTVLAATGALVLAGTVRWPRPDPVDTSVEPGAPGARPGPASVLVGPDLQAVPLRGLTRARPQLLVLVSCWCGPTYAVASRVPGWRQRLPRADVLLVHTQAPFEHPELADLGGLWWDPGAQLHRALGLGTGSYPQAVLLDAAHPAPLDQAAGPDGIEALVRRWAD
jgi:hypothetical protein